MPMDFYDLEEHEMREADRAMEKQVKDAVIDSLLWLAMVCGFILIVSAMGVQ